jgi:hypothetical protein
MIKWTAFRVKVLILSLVSLFLIGIFMVITFNKIFNNVDRCTVINYKVTQRNITMASYENNTTEWQVALSWLYKNTIWIIDYGWTNNYNNIVSFLGNYPINHNDTCIISGRDLYLYSSVKFAMICDFIVINMGIIVLVAFLDFIIFFLIIVK